MSDAAKNNTLSCQQFAELVRSSLETVLSQALMKPWSVSSTEEKEASDGTVELMFSVTKALAGKLVFRLSEADTALLAGLFAGEEQAASKLTPELREAVEELFRQICGSLATETKNLVGETSFELSTSEEQGKCSDGIRYCFTAQAQGLQPILVHLGMDGQLCADLSKARTESQTLPVAHTEEEDLKNLDLLMGVELSATLRFGQLQMRMKDILDLGSGAVIELNRKVNDPVELLLDGKVFAEGEVVVVDGDYGLRVTRVASRAEKVSYLQ